MQRDIEALSKQKFDLAVIGGGIQGAATAREAALRGLKVALVEARDFASGTSSRSSKLIHGGLRYLEQLEFKLVHEARRERQLLMKLAPHLARPQPFLLPIYENDPFSSLKVRTGLTIYDLFGNLGKKDRHRMVRRDTAIGLMPALRAEGLEAGALYHDSTTDDARLTIENVLDAANHGAVVANYAELRALEVSADGKDEITSGEVEDRLTGRRVEIAARFWVNAAGPWVDRVRALLPQFDGSNTVRLTKGTHLIVPAVTGRLALLAAVAPGDRVFLMVPWHGHALLGTTDTDFEEDPTTVAPDPADIEYLLNAANRVLRHPLTTTDVKGSWAGVRALAIEPEKPGESPSDNTREYRFHEDPWANNFVSICGGKLTTARALGDKLVDQVAARLGAATNGVSSRAAPLPGGHTGKFGAFVNYAAWEAVRQYDVPYEIGERIVRTYGSRWRQVLELIRTGKALAEPLPGEPSLLAAEVDFAIRQEMAVKAEDFLYRRSGLNWAAGLTKEVQPAVEEIFARHFASLGRGSCFPDAGGSH
ncbi:MAG TPA: glycerol-3-phosphate dehydrogenase [Terriglobia bacterium]|nr:glycerol-3-phosphate dehydrogenase [Terriglobia bacterium]